MKKYLIAACVILAIACAAMVGVVKNLHSERDRLAANQNALMADVEYYQTEAGNYAASVQALELTKSEMEDYCANLTKTIEDLNIKLKRVQAAATTATKTEVRVETVVRDSIIYRDTSFIKVQAIEWKDNWVSVSGLIHGNKDVDMEVVSVDTLKQVIHRVPKKWWFFKWGTKAIQQEVISSNPHTKIVYTEYIELSKKKK